MRGSKACPKHHLRKHHHCWQARKQCRCARKETFSWSTQQPTFHAPAPNAPPVTVRGLTVSVQGPHSRREPLWYNLSNHLYTRFSCKNRTLGRIRALFHLELFFGCGQIHYTFLKWLCFYEVSAPGNLVLFLNPNARANCNFLRRKL